MALRSESPSRRAYARSSSPARPLSGCISTAHIPTSTFAHQKRPPRRVPVSKRAVKAFKSLLPDKKLGIAKHKVLSIETPRAIGHSFRAVVKGAEFPDLRWHDLRHEAVSRLFESTVLRDNEIMAISEHLSTEMRKRYSHLRSHRLASRLG